MRVRRVQEVEISDLSERLLSARKASDMSLLEICRQLEITPTYWYKLEKGGADTINYDLLTKIEELLLLNLGIEFSDRPHINPYPQEKNMDLSRLKWIKVVTPPNDWHHQWALSPNELTDPQLVSGSHETIVLKNGLTIVPLGFKDKGAEKLNTGDLMVLTQRAKITHIVEVLDDQPYEKGGWFHRYVKIVWWKPELDWYNLPHREDMLDFTIQIQKGIPYGFTSFEAFRNRWDNAGGLPAFQSHLVNQLKLLSEVV